MFIPGPSSISILFLRNSLPCISYSFSVSSVLKLQAISVPLGFENALVPQSILIPDGPSEQPAIGIPNPLSSSVTPPMAPAIPDVTLGEHIPSPRVIYIRSLSDSCAMKSSIDTFPSATSESL